MLLISVIVLLRSHQSSSLNLVLTSLETIIHCLHCTPVTQADITRNISGFRFVSNYKGTMGLPYG